MKTLSLHQEFDITVIEIESWVYETHKHNFFEIIYVLEGKGNHFINDNCKKYSKGSLFFLSPNDYHSFKIEENTGLCIITFTKIYFSKEQSQKYYSVDFSELFKKIEIVFYNANFFYNEFSSNESEFLFIEMLIKKLINEMKEKHIYYETIVQNSVFLLLNIIARNIQQNANINLKTQNSKSEISEIINYIQHNIYEKEKLKIASIANHFFKSKNYISQYFKSETGESLKNYISKYKINLVKNRLIHSNLTILQIANELEYTDESHLNKIFKLFFNQTANQYRKDQLGDSMETR